MLMRFFPPLAVILAGLIAPANAQDSHLELVRKSAADFKIAAASAADVEFDCAGEHAKKNLLAQGEYSLVFQRASFPDDAAFTITISDITLGAAKSISVGSLSAADLAPARTGGFAESVPIRLRTGRLGNALCPKLRLRLVAENDSGRRAQASIFWARHAYVLPPAGPGFRLESAVCQNDNESALVALKRLRANRDQQWKFGESAAKAAAAVAKITFQPTDMAKSISCTGFAVAERAVITNQHCVAEARRKAQESASTKCPGKKVSMTVGLDPNSGPSSVTWECKEILAESEALDFAVLELKEQQGRSWNIVPLAFSETKAAPSGGGEGNSANCDAAGVPEIIALHHPRGESMKISSRCGALWPRAGESERFAMASLGIGDNEAGLRHGCSTRKGSSGAPILSYANGVMRVAALHYAGFVTDEIEENGHVQLYEQFLSDNSASLIKRNFAMDGFYIRCALEADRVIPESSACQGFVEPTKKETPTFSPDPNEVWEAYKRDNLTPQ
jgi:hypothetical protein